MVKIEQLANDLHMDSKELIKESVETFLRHKLKTLSVELFLLVKKQGVNNVLRIYELGKAKNGQGIS